MLNMVGTIHQITGNLENDKKSMRILKSQRRAIFVVIILVMIIDISDFLTHTATFFHGVLTGVVSVTCTKGLFINFKLSKRIGTRIRENLD
ncbi:hypothetical protein HPT25_03625 [Bacillus sp. BRMEA1]|uniref:hypothetical protein n=1 Tax=Neobacillus endophyticus TaxID=2738405 RepID=UPI001564D220|nr:hypothetical protein [Neobacillus endophyticus]NRD76580.1 hypothetical protein [Neobacillus endophyticus]